MSEKVYWVYTILVDCSILISFLFSIFYWKSIRKMMFLRLFPFYTGFSLITDCFNYFPKYRSNHLPLNIFIVVEFLFFYQFYRNVLKEKKTKNILTILAALFIVFFITTLIVFRYQNPILPFFSIFNTPLLPDVVVIENILLVIPILLYYKSLFNPPFIRKNLTNDPIFLIMTGVLFCFSISTPFFLFEKIIAVHDRDSYYYLFMINAIAYTIMHIFFIKAYLNIKVCLKPL